MKDLAILRPGQRWKAWLLALAACAIILAGGVLVGFASGRSKAHAGQQQRAAGSQQQLNATQLPLPNSAAAQQLLADPLTPGWLRELYTYEEDSSLITAEHTAALLQLLQQALRDSPAAAGGSGPGPTAGQAAAAASYGALALHEPPSTSSPAAAAASGAAATADLQPFITAAADVLSYLRAHDSRALLPLLRAFSRNGVNGLAAVSLQPELLRFELQQLLHPHALQQWYLDAAAGRVGAGGLTARSTQQQQQQRTGFLVVPRHSRRRLQAGVDTPADLTSALLSKMQAGSMPSTARSTTPTPAPTPPSFAEPNTARVATAAAAPAKAEATEPAAAAAEAAAPAVIKGGAAARPWATSTALTMAAAASDAATVGWPAAGAAPAAAAASPVKAASVTAASAPVSSTVGTLAVEDDAKYGERDSQDSGAAEAAAAEEEGEEEQRQEVGLESDSAAKEEGEGEGEGEDAAGAAGGDTLDRRGRDSEGGYGGSSSSSGWLTYPDAGRQPTAAGSKGRWKASLSSSSSRHNSRGAKAGALQAVSVDGEGEESADDADGSGSRHAAAWTAAVPAGHAAVHKASGSPGNSAAAAAAAAAGAVCAIQQFLPAGLQRIADAVLCSGPSLSQYGYPTGTWMRQQLTIPVIFHCLKFTRALGSGQAVLLPPNWLDSAGSNLIDQANKVFHNTGIQFKLQEVRQDPANHPYLLQADLQAWQGCTHNAASTAAGEACLRGVVSRQQSTAPLAVHVVVSGSRDEFCNPAPVGSSVCSSITPGRGSPDDWVFLSWDAFNPSAANSPRFANRGASILAAQLAQYLGLNPTAAGPAAAGPAAAGPAAAGPAAAPQTGCILSRQQLPRLAAWCSRFRQGLGQQPSLQELLSAASECPGGAFSVLEPSVPDSCALAFSSGQVASLQAAVAMMSPKLQAAWACEQKL